MRRVFSYRLDGEEVIRTLEVYDDKGELQDRSEIRLGNRDIVLGQLTEQATEAKEEADGVQAAAAEQPVAPTGTPGKSCQWFLRGKQIYCTEIERRKDGKVQSARTRPLGHRANVIENRTERAAELEAERKGVEEAK